MTIDIHSTIYQLKDMLVINFAKQYRFKVIEYNFGIRVEQPNNHQKMILSLFSTEYFLHICNSALENSFELHPWLVDSQMDKNQFEDKPNAHDLHIMGWNGGRKIQWNNKASLKLRYIHIYRYKEWTQVQLLYVNLSSPGIIILTGYHTRKYPNNTALFDIPLHGVYEINLFVYSF